MTQNSSLNRRTGNCKSQHLSRQSMQNVPLTATDGFSLVELLAVIAVIGVLATMAIPAYNSYMTKSRSYRAAADIRTLSTDINAYYIDKGNYPPNLAAINRNGFLDPWNRPYVYHSIANGDALLEGALETLNQSYDIFSKGADGDSAVAFGDPLNKDDIVNYSDGTYVGMRDHID